MSVVAWIWIEAACHDLNGEASLVCAYLPAFSWMGTGRGEVLSTSRHCPVAMAHQHQRFVRALMSWDI